MTITYGFNAWLQSAVSTIWTFAQNIRIGGQDSASPSATSLGVQSVAAGTSNVAGANFTINGSQGTGTGAGGSIVFRTAAAEVSGSTQNPLTPVLTLAADKSATFAGAISAAGDFVAPITAGYTWAGRTRMLGGLVDGNLAITNNAGSNFGLLQFGGTTSAYPALKRSGAALEFRLADDSDWAAFRTGNLIAAGAAVFNGATTMGAGQLVRIRIITAAGTVAVATNDYVVSVNKTVAASTVVNLPASPNTGQVFIIKDGKGDAAANNITVTPAAGTIDGGATYVINVNYGSATLVYNGTQWNLI